MKKIALLTLVFFAKNVTGQIALENSYQTDTTNNAYYYTGAYIQGAGFKYIFRQDNDIKLYNLNHSLFKTITIPSFSGSITSEPFYISSGLFDTDTTDIEYLISVNNSITFPYDFSMKVIKEDGTVIFSEDSSYLSYDYLVAFYNNGMGNSIYYTENGFKMVLWKGDNKTNVYSLPGRLPMCTKVQNIDMNQTYLSFPYPNPSQSSVKINYQLPQGVNSGEIIFYTLQGREIKRLKIDKTFSSIEIDNSDLTSGTYLYSIVSSNNLTSAKQMVVIK